jgi:hypothetical protein
VYTDVTDRDGAAPPHPDQVVAFQELGYQVLGLVTLDVDPGGFEAVAADYAPGDREQALEHFTDPATVLRSADGLVLAQVCWFWSGPGLVLKTWMSDESLVETWRRWPVVPPWPGKRAAAWRYATVEGEMTRQAADGRSVATVPDADPDRLDEAHRAHVRAYAETYGCEPVAAPEAMPEVLAALERATVHMWRVAEVYARAGNILVVLIALAAAAWSWAVLEVAVPWAPLWAVCGVLGALLSLHRFSVRFAYTRWWRPAYR